MKILVPDKRLPKKSYFESTITPHKFIMFKVMRDKLDTAIRKQAPDGIHYILVSVIGSTEYFHSAHPLMFTTTLNVRDSL
jgi:hypothetical protein